MEKHTTDKMGWGWVKIYDYFFVKIREFSPNTF